jgi:biopolymer transport protein ExbD
MSRRPRAPQTSGIFDVNMTPLIDVSLVLVVILMVATPLALQSSIAFNTGSAGARRAAPVRAPSRVDIALLTEQSVRVNHTVVTRAQLAGTLGPLLKANAGGVVVVRCADGVTHGAFVDVIDEARALGAAQIVVVGS